LSEKNEKQDQQERAAFNERIPKHKEPPARSQANLLF
jgi:hypothetical protein